MRTLIYFLLMLCVLPALAQQAPNYEQAYGYMGLDSSAMHALCEAVEPGQYLLGGELNDQPVLVLADRAGQRLAHELMEMDGEVRNLVKLDNGTYAAAGICTGCGGSGGQQAVFLSLYDEGLAPLASLVMAPTLAEARFDSPFLATDGTQVFLVFNDNYFGGSHHVRAYDASLAPIWEAYHDLGFVERPVGLEFREGELLLYAREFNDTDSNIGSRIARLSADGGGLLSHFAYPGVVMQAALLTDGLVAMASYAAYYEGAGKVKLSLTCPVSGEVRDSAVLGSHPESRSTALCALPNGEWLLAMDEVGFWTRDLELYRFGPDELGAALGAHKVYRSFGTDWRVLHALLPLSDDGEDYVGVGQREDDNRRGLFLSHYPGTVSPVPPSEWSSDLCGSTLLEVPKQAHYPACMPKVYRGVVYDTAALLYDGQPVDLTMNVYVPYDLYSTADTTQRQPLLVMVNGGAFLDGSGFFLNGSALPEGYAEIYDRWGLLLAERGYVVASINYRLGLADGVTEIAQFPDHQQALVEAIYRGNVDTRKAVHFLDQHAVDYHIDPGQIFLMGHSAGAMNVLHAALMDEADIPPIFQYLLTEIGPLPPKPPVRAYVSWAGQIFDLEMIGEEDNAPLFFIHGTCDASVPYDSGNILLADQENGFGALRIAGVKEQLCQEYHLLAIEGGDHIMGGREEAVWGRLLEWLKSEAACGTASRSCEAIPAANPIGCAAAMLCPGAGPCTINMAEALERPVPADAFPNPNDGQFTLRLPWPAEVCVYDAAGRRLSCSYYGTGEYAMRIDAAAGVYVLELRQEGKRQMLEVVKR